MKWLTTALNKIKKNFGKKDAGSSKGKCPLKETGLLVVVVLGYNKGVVQGATVDVEGRLSFSKKKVTDKDGLAMYKPTEPDTYKIAVELPSNMANTFDKPNITSQVVSLGQCPVHVVRIEERARPKIKLQWQDTKKPVGGVGITILGTNHDFGKTTPADGTAQLQSDQPGILPGTYTLHFNLKSKDLVNAEVIDAGKPIKLPSGCRETFTYELRKSWVEFVIIDQFDRPVSDLEYTLTYPDGKKVKNGKLKDGKVREEGPPGQYKLALKFIYFTAWEYSPLKVGEPVKLVVRLNGYDKDTDVLFEIYDSCGLAGAPLDTVTAKVGESDTLEVDWTPEAGKLRNAISGKVVLLAKVGNSQAISNPVLITEKLEFEVKQDGAPLETTLALDFSGGFSDYTEWKDGKAEVLVPVGQQLVSIGFPDEPGERVGLESNGTEQTFSI